MHFILATEFDLKQAEKKLFEARKIVTPIRMQID